MLYLGSIMCVCVCVCVQSLQSCPTLCDPPDYSLQAPLSMGFSRQEYSSGLPCPSLEDFPTCISYVSCIGRYVLYHQCYLRSPNDGCLPLNTDSGSLGMSLIHLITFSEIDVRRKSYKYNVWNSGCLLACVVFFLHHSSISQVRPLNLKESSSQYSPVLEGDVKLWDRQQKEISLLCITQPVCQIISDMSEES